jgi:uncharacterized protein
MSCVTTQRDQLLERLATYHSCLVAFSGGVDSAVVAKAARVALGDNCVAVTGTSPSLAAGELDQAASVARAIGIRHETIATGEFDNPAYTQNASDRCFHCKSELYALLRKAADQGGIRVIANGANQDDLSDYRPGMQAARQFGVRSPLADCRFTKADVRALALLWELPVWNKPASPCLSSRVAYGQEVTPERLAMIDRAEQFLRGHGFSPVRVRYHRGDLARIELEPQAVQRACREDFRAELIRHLRSLGFRFVTLDLQGFRSGSLNTLVIP